MNNDTFDFSLALRLVKEEKRISRLQFGTTCYIRLKKFEPAETHTGVLNQDYLEMVKRVKVFADNEPGGEHIVCFPFVPSSESILAEDWYIVEGEFNVN